MAYKCYGVEKLYPIDDMTIVGYQEYQTINGQVVKTDSMLLIRAVNNSFQFSDPDGTERDYWLNKIGVLSDKAFVESAKIIQAKGDREKLYHLLDKEFKVKK